MKKKSWLTGLLVLSVAVVMAAAIDLTGKWEGTLEISGGTYPVTYNFKVDGEKLTGTAESPDGTADIDSGVVKANDLKFNLTLSNGETIHNTGKFYGDSTTLDFQAVGQKFHVKLLRAK